MQLKLLADMAVWNNRLLVHVNITKLTLHRTANEQITKKNYAVVRDLQFLHPKDFLKPELQHI